MELKKALAIGAAAACTLTFNGCVIAPANGYGYGQPYAPVYVAPTYPLIVPNVYIGPRPAPYYGRGFNPGWGSPRFSAPAPRWGGGHGWHR